MNEASVCLCDLSESIANINFLKTKELHHQFNLLFDYLKGTLYVRISELVVVPTHCYIDNSDSTSMKYVPICVIKHTFNLKLKHILCKLNLLMFN